VLEVRFFDGERLAGTSLTSDPSRPGACDYMESRVDEVAGQFGDAVASGRGTSVATVQNTFGQECMVPAREAVRRGMAGKVGTLEDAVAAAVQARAPGRSSNNARVLC